VVFPAEFYTLKLIPSHVWIVEGELLGLLGFGVLAVVWVLLPFWEVNRTKVAMGVTVFLICYLAVFTYLGYVK